MSYDDGLVACTDDAVLIRHYYFPFGDKRLPYAGIQKVAVRPMTSLFTGRGRVWGSGDLKHWFNLDPGRPGKSVKLEITPRGRGISPVITPDKPEEVIAELTAHGVTVTRVLLCPCTTQLRITVVARVSRTLD